MNIPTIITSVALAVGSLPSTNSLIGLFVWVAVAALIVWGVVALVKWSGVPIPQPVWIVLTVLIGVFLILLIARFFGIVT